MGTEDEGLFPPGDPFDDPLWQQAELMVDAPPRPAKGYVTCRLAWLARVRLVVNTPDQLIVALLLYRKCLMTRSRTVKFSNATLAELGISRHTKYCALRHLQDAGVIALAEVDNGRAVEVTLRWFP